MELPGIFTIFLTFLVFNCNGVSAEDKTQYTYGLMEVYQVDPGMSVKSNRSVEICFTYPPKLFDLSTISKKLYFMTFPTVDMDLCEFSHGKDPPSANISDTLFAMEAAPNCSLINYINYTRDESAAGLIVVSSNRYLLNNTYGLDIISIISNSSFGEIKNWPSDIEHRVKILSVKNSNFDSSMLLLWAVACFCVFWGSYLSPHPRLTSSEQQVLDGPVSPDEKPYQVNISVGVVLALVVLISATLLLLYFFYKYLVYFFMAIFCFSSAAAVYCILDQLFVYFKLTTTRLRVKSCELHQIFLTVVSMALPVIWIIFRHDSNIWILQDLLGMCFCIYLIQTLRMPNLKVCTILVSLLFVYDVFFVFVTPYITPDGKSVMIEVATGGSTNESLPLLFKFPHFKSSVLSVCTPQGFSLLGFGDIIVPGFLVCFARSFDVLRGEKGSPYFISTLLGYGFGLSMAFVVLFVTRSGQPALLYIVPATLIPIYSVSLWKKQFNELWTGSIKISEI